MENYIFLLRVYLPPPLLGVTQLVFHQDLWHQKNEVLG